MHKKILLGITGCIAAYKAAELVRSLQKALQDVEIKVLMTKAAQKFIGADTFRALTGNDVSTQVFDDEDPIPHINYASNADLYVIAPCTANTISKLACGLADNLVSATALACTAPILIAPAMNVHMWENQATQKNIATLKKRGIKIIEPASGMLACGEDGKGKLASINQITDEILYSLQIGNEQDLVGKRILITAGPTHEQIDPVRFLSNESSGKMGYALASCAVFRGANVTLVSGPCNLEPPAGIEFVQVQSALQMHEACKESFFMADAAIFSAAVSDWRPQNLSTQKIKHDELYGAINTGQRFGTGEHLEEEQHLEAGAQTCTGVRKKINPEFNLPLTANPDIAASLCANKGSRFCIAFAAETENLIENAQKKLITKNADMIVANDVSNPEQVFGSDSNQVCFITRKTKLDLGRQSKRDIAIKLLDIVAMVLNGEVA